MILESVVQLIEMLGRNIRSKMRSSSTAPLQQGDHPILSCHSPPCSLSSTKLLPPPPLRTTQAMDCPLIPIRTVFSTPVVVETISREVTTVTTVPRSIVLETFTTTELITRECEVRRQNCPCETATRVLSTIYTRELYSQFHEFQMLLRRSHSV